MDCLFKMSDEELRNWQRSEIAKSRVENLFNQVIETYRTFQDSYNNSIFNQQHNHNQLEESAISMAISAHGLQGGSSRANTNNVENIVGSSSTSSNSIIHENTDNQSIFTENATNNFNDCNLDDTDPIAAAINTHGLKMNLSKQRSVSSNKGEENFNTE